jgi:hypothetical protein
LVIDDEAAFLKIRKSPTSKVNGMDSILCLFHLRDFATMNKECIRRKFYLMIFGSITEAESSQYIHNSMLSVYSDDQKAKRGKLDLGANKNEKHKQDDAAAKTTKEDVATTDQRLKKKERYVSIVS